MLAGLFLAAALTAAPPNGFIFAAGGDMIGPYRGLSQTRRSRFDRRFVQKRADLGFANQEGSIFEIRNFRGFPAAENGGGYPLQPPSFARDIKTMGISLVSKANNHATDWGSEGLAETLGWLAASGIVAGGAGEGLDKARAPVYLDTVKGKVALVDTASTFSPMAVAGPPVMRFNTNSRPRPGIAPLHVREVGRVTPLQLAALRRDAGALNLSGDGHEVRLGDQIFSDRLGPRWEMDGGDESAILASLKEARAKARFVLFSIHAHQTGGPDEAGAPGRSRSMVQRLADEAASPSDPRPADFEPALFHAAIDAGADAVVRTGSHVLGGIEIYKGKPIFYSLGSLFFDFRGRRSFTGPTGKTVSFPDGYFETVIPLTRYKNGKVDEIRLYPFVIEVSTKPTGGIPQPATPDQAKKILGNLKTMSAAFGTKISIENGVGVIKGG